MNPAAQPEYAVVEGEGNNHDLVILYNSPEGNEEHLVLCSSPIKGFLEQTKTDMECAMIPFEEYAEDWGIEASVFKAILASIKPSV